MNFKITKTKQLKIIKELDAACLGRHVAMDAEELRTTHWLLVRVGDKAVGYAGLRIMKGATKAVGFLSRVGVLPEYRGHGLQKKLIRARERMARKLDCGWCVTYTYAKTSASPNSLISCGYHLYRPEWAWAGQDWLYLRRKL